MAAPPDVTDLDRLAEALARCLLAWAVNATKLP